jgi:hypothetical protein
MAPACTYDGCVRCMRVFIDFGLPIVICGIMISVTVLALILNVAICLLVFSIVDAVGMIGKSLLRKVRG